MIQHASAEALTLTRAQSPALAEYGQTTRMDWYLTDPLDSKTRKRELERDKREAVIGALLSSY